MLRRFVPNSTEKNQTQVNFGTAGVNLERYFAATSIPHDAKSMIAHDYDVFGSIHHMGHYLGSGHFVAFARNWIDQNWYFFDDEKVQPVADQTQICSRDAYIVFLQKRKK